MDAICPRCDSAMNWQHGNTFQCAVCRQRYLREANCPDCQHALQVLTACGAVDYLCQQHGLISKKRVLFSYLPANPSA
ncbi:zinc ribbon domain-containing protein [Brenneria rubrifaciens]|uniref:Primosomal protein N' (Replication factor Y)-superfamily II helicase n=1 Tax=Brenneria rubrifaciens TaxID=55213 RepID=A0A4V1F9Z8_9GAMM|nr:zinc ribbon domain-containing protein [Brenneria rubrifaciens]QCR09323.1 hypothetical protein EH207_12795 [Brenneria rubrifaciens]